MAGELGHVLVDARRARSAAAATAAAWRPWPRRRRAARAAAPQPRRRLTVADMLRLARDGDLGCRRVIADAGRAIGARRGDLCQPAQPAAARRRRRPRRGRRPAARRRARARSTRRAAGRGERSARSSPGVLGERAEVLGALALVVGEAAPRSDLHESHQPTDSRRGSAMKKGAVWLAIATVRGKPGRRGLRRRRGRGRWRQRRVSEESGGDVGRVAVLLPDSKSSVRWETVDRPFLQKAFDAAGVEATIQNAEGDKATQQQQAEQAITNGAKVILLVNLDSGSGAAIEATAAVAGRQGDRLRPPDAQLAERRLLRLVRQRGGRQAAGRGPRRVHGRQVARPTSRC